MDCQQTETPKRGTVGPKTKWQQLECDRGNRWNEIVQHAVVGELVPRGPLEELTEEGAPCNFRGCPKGHFVHIRGYTENAHDAFTWFKDVNEERGVL